VRLTECEVPWLEDDGVSKIFHLKTRGTPMSETPISRLRSRMIEDMSLRKFGENDYIRHVKTFSTFLGGSHYGCPLDLLTPPRPRKGTPE
jgi:hypothetical protein